MKTTIVLLMLATTCASANRVYINQVGNWEVWHSKDVMTGRERYLYGIGSNCGKGSFTIVKCENNKDVLLLAYRWRKYLSGDAVGNVHLRIRTDKHPLSDVVHFLADRSDKNNSGHVLITSRNAKGFMDAFTGSEHIWVEVVDPLDGERLIHRFHNKRP
jgi:hypothetical protein